MQREHQCGGMRRSRNSHAPIGTMKNGASEPISAALATLLLRRAGEEDGEVQAEEDARDQRLAHVAHRHPSTGAPEVGVPDDADDDQPPERDAYQEGGLEPPRPCGH